MNVVTRTSILAEIRCATVENERGWVVTTGRKMLIINRKKGLEGDDE